VEKHISANSEIIEYICGDLKSISAEIKVFTILYIEGIG
jgi:hypothetical protein